MTTTAAAAPKDDHKILCCLCGIPITPNPSSMCINCIKSQVDISEDINKQETIMFCRECERYLQPPKYWVAAQLESRELMTLCLKRIKGLNKVKLVDATWVWTEPHSRRLKVKLTIQKEVFNGTVLQQSFVVEYIVKNQQCETCQRSYTTKTWSALVQLRQKVDHKRTFFYLEQLILKHNAHSQCINIKDRPDGIDFYFNQRSHALKFVDFVSSVSPVRTNDAKRLITQDDHNNSYEYKYTFSSEIAPICREDIVCLPKKLSTSMGGIGPIVICTKINTHLHLMDPTTLQTTELPGNFYWKQPFRALMDSRKQMEFTVLDVEPVREKPAGSGKGPLVQPNRKYQLADVTIVRSDEVGDENHVVFVRTHLGGVLQPGDRVMGYDVKNANLNDDALPSYNMEDLPDVVLCHKFHDKTKNKKKRKWQLKQLQKVEAGSDDESDMGDVVPSAAPAAGATAAAAAKSKATDKAKDKRANTRRDRNMREYEQFLDELEQDQDMRKGINLYKKKPAASAAPSDAAAAAAAKQQKAADGEDEGSDDDSDVSDGVSVDDAELQDMDNPAAEQKQQPSNRHGDDLDDLEQSSKALSSKMGSLPAGNRGKQALPANTKGKQQAAPAQEDDEDDGEDGDWEDVDDEAADN